MARYEADIYFSGYIRMPVEASSEDEAVLIGREEAARLRNKREGHFNEEFLPSLEPWREADTATKIE